MSKISISAITTIKDGVLVLPEYLKKRWQQKKVFVIPASNRIIIQPVEQDWETYEAKLKAGKKMISSNVIKQAVRAAKKSG